MAHPITREENFEISLLIGADHYWDFIEDHIIRGNGPTAMQSKLGYLLSGPLPTVQKPLSNTNILHTCTTCNEEDQQENFWNVESTDITNPKETDTGFLQQYQKSSISREPDGGYTAKFPWKYDHAPLPTNYAVCERRTRSLARRLKQVPELLEKYNNIIAEQERRGFIEKIHSSAFSKHTHYIPHHAVQKASSTTPVRIVYDCSCHQSKDHPSLNDCLMVGPPFQNEICSIILRFRFHAIALSTDIEKAFLHVNLNEADRDYTRFLWLSIPSDPESAFQTYRFKSVLFGSASSPFILNAVLSYHLDQFKSPVAADMKRNLYVDNIISGVSSESLATEYYTETRSIMLQAKFNLRSWASNSKELQALAMTDGVADKDTNVNILGLRWNISTDMITFVSKDILPLDISLTSKREVLQHASRLYDPLGFLAPVTIQAKIFMQELWKQNLSWDEPLNEALRHTWYKIAQEIQRSINMVLPRRYCISFHSTTSLKLHVFADASTKAYGAVAYLCEGQQSSLVMARTRVAPLKTKTLPRLELMAAVIGARLAKFIKSSLTPLCTDISTFLWSDSQIVLHWLNSHKTLKQFVTSRVQEITESFPYTMWKYCPTADNPADLLTRGISAAVLEESTLWRHGPTWLNTNEWPVWEYTEVLHLQTGATNSEEEKSRAKTNIPNILIRFGIRS